MTIGGLIIAAFFIGRYTAQLPAASTPPVDPCEAIVSSANKLSSSKASPGSSEYEFDTRTLGHLIVDHPNCFSPELVAQYKTVLDTAPR